MAFDLHIRISGLCLFVPAADGKRMHILMPDTRPGGDAHHPDIPEHEATITYDTRLEASGQTGRPTSPVRMEGYSLDFRLTTGQYPLRMPTQVVDCTG